MKRAHKAKLILWLITGFAGAVGLNRFVFGLGVTTNLTDATPWGLWIGFDVMAGVALAAGGFVTTALFYIMRKEEFHPLVKPAVLTAFLGYLAVVFGLMFDLGLPWNIWHMIIYWNPHSPLFEVGWCVMLYTAVLFLEFSPVPLEKFGRYAKIRNFLMKFRFPLVLLGIMLSTLHQSSLGSLFLIMPFKLHPLWYSNILPIHFFISAIALGLMTVALESKASHWLYRRNPETNIIAKLGRAAVWVLTLYFAVKFADLAVSGKLPLLFSGSRESWLFITEIMISAVIPIAIFSNPRLRDNGSCQWIGSFTVVFGMIFNRINVGGLAMVGTTGDAYIPSWMEISISLGVVSAAGLVFLAVIENFSIWDVAPKDAESLALTPPVFDYSSRVWLGQPGTSALVKYSLAFIISFSLGMALMPERQVFGRGIESVAVNRANGKDTLQINGNKDEFYVEFPHEDHIKRIGEAGCVKCHHLTLPGSRENQCWECHTSMYETVDFFGHDRHASKSGAGIRCDGCHKRGDNRSAGTAKSCTECHIGYEFAKKSAEGRAEYRALSYTDAMHKLCVSCHSVSSAKGSGKPDLNHCPACHVSGFTREMEKSIRWEVSLPHFNRVTLPDAGLTKIQEEEK